MSHLHDRFTRLSKVAQDSLDQTLPVPYFTRSETHVSAVLPARVGYALKTLVPFRRLPSFFEAREDHKRTCSTSPTVEDSGDFTTDFPRTCSLPKEQETRKDIWNIFTFQPPSACIRRSAVGVQRSSSGRRAALNRRVCDSAAPQLDPISFHPTLCALPA